MRVLSYLITGISTFILLACNDPIDLEIAIPDEIEPVSLARNTRSNETLTDGSIALFNTQGSLNFHNKVLTLKNNYWESDEQILWPNNPDTTTITAIHPIYNNLLYESDSLYRNHILADILIARDTIIGKQEFKLTFKHLFSQLSIQVPPNIQQNLEEIRLIVPQSISKIIPETGEIIMSDKPYTNILSRNETGEYTYNIPPLISTTLNLDIITTNKQYSSKLPSHTFEKNTKYICNIRQLKGIQNAEDLIAFSLLINGMKYTGSKKLEDFREINGSDTIYYLTDDIKLSEKDCNELLPIGAITNKEFNHIFEGNGHTIFNLIIPDKSINSNIYTFYSGFFGCIGPKGKVQNLHIQNARSVESPTCSYTGILCGNNNGKIINCSVSESIITAGTNSTRLGIICGCSDGYIINSYSENNSIKIKGNCTSGGIAGHASGYILNCYAYNNSYNTAESAHTGGIVGQSNNNIFLELNNCCVYHPTIPGNYFGSIIGYLRNAALNNICYNNGNAYYDGKNATIKNKHIYDSTFKQDGKHISAYLNEWIEETGATAYPNIIFKKWKTEGLPRFE